ncbi:MAG: hypothetical protein OEW19_00295 [Acidobacteriota bacterium]|nr:hypothetical protein [Acidobacteriota bacterium]
MLTVAASASAQVLGTYRWQTQPSCNVITVAVTQVDGTYRLEGTDDQCGANSAAGAIGVALPNPNGTIGFGLSIVGSPGGSPVAIEATIALATLNGTWRDSAGGSGNFVFTPGTGSAGPARLTIAPGVQFRVENLTSGLAVGIPPTVLTNWSTTPTYNDGGGVYDPATGAYTVPAAGLYHIAVTARWTTFPSSTGQPVDRRGSWPHTGPEGHHL